MATRKRSGGGSGSGKPKLKTHHEKVEREPSAGARGGAGSRGGAGARRARPAAAKAKPRRPALPLPVRGGANREAARAQPAATPATGASGGGVGGGPVKTRKPPETSLASDEARRLAITIAAAALEKKAVGLEVLDVAGKVDYADFLVLMSGRSDRQVAALAEGIQEALSKAGRRPLSIEGMPTARWVLMDYGDVVVHVFQEEARSMYDIEGLWMDAGRLPIPHADVP